MPLTITEEELRRFARNAKPVYIDTLLENLHVLEEAGILDNGLRLSHFMGQCSAETGGFVVLRESLAYRTPDRLRAVWPSRFRNKSDAYLNGLITDQVKLADEVYGGRMGNRKGTSDGFDYRGGMFLQTTGRYAVEKYCAQLGETPSPQSLDDPVLTLRFACLEWQQSGCNDWADQDDVLKVSKAINTGSATSNVAPVGMPDRRQWLAQAKKIWEHAKPVNEAADPPIVAANTPATTAEGAGNGEAAEAGMLSGRNFAKLNELADQGSRVASHLRNLKAAIWKRTATGAGTAVTIASTVDTEKGTGAVISAWASAHPFLFAFGLLATVLIAYEIATYAYAKAIEKGLLSAAKDNRYSPRGVAQKG